MMKYGNDKLLLKAIDPYLHNILTYQTDGYSSNSLKPPSLQSRGHPSGSFTHLPI